MIWVELIGPSGVGKSYLFKELLKTRNSEDWITPEEAFETLYEKLTLNSEISLKNRFLSSLKRYLLQRETDTFNKIPSDIKRSSIEDHGSRFNFLSELLIKKLATESKLEPKKKIKMISWYYENRLIPFIVLYAANLDRTIVFEDGIFHNNLIMNLEKYTDQIETEGQIIYPDAIICLNAEPEMIFDRIKHRNRTAGGTFIQRDYSDKQLKESVRSSVEDHHTIFNQLKKNDQMILEIDATDSVLENCEKINSFIKDLNGVK